MLFSETGRDVALRAIELTGATMECCGKAAAFVQRRCLAIKGHHRSVRWCANKLFSEAVRDVALRAIELTGASALRLWSVATMLGDKGPSPNCSVACEHVV